MNEIDILDIDKININNNLIDIRDKYQYNISHIPRSINVPYNYLMINSEDYLSKNNTYYLYCNSGITSKKLSNYLNNYGYNTYSLVGGFNKYITK